MRLVAGSLLLLAVTTSQAACATFEPAGLVSVAPARTTVYPEPSSTP